MPQTAWAEYDTISVVLPLYAEDGSVAADIPVVFSLNRNNSTCNIGFYRCDSIERITSYVLTYYQAVEPENWGNKAGALVVPQTITHGNHSYTVKGVGAYAFSEATTGLTGISLPQTVDSIGINAFTSCAAMKIAVLPDKLKFLGESAFFGCSALTAVTIPSGFRRIYESTFYGCAALTELVVPEGVTVIERKAFSDCSGLTYLELPSTIRQLYTHDYEYESSMTGLKSLRHLVCKFIDPSVIGKTSGCIFFSTAGAAVGDDGVYVATTLHVPFGYRNAFASYEADKHGWGRFRQPILEGGGRPTLTQLTCTKETVSSGTRVTLTPANADEGIYYWVGENTSPILKYTEPFVFSGVFAELKFYAVKGGNSSTCRTEYISNSGAPAECAKYYFRNATGGYIQSMDVTFGDTVELPDFISETAVVTPVVKPFSATVDGKAAVLTSGNNALVGVALGEADYVVTDYETGCTYSLHLSVKNPIETISKNEETSFDFSITDQAGNERLSLSLGAEDTYNEEEGRVEIGSTNTEEEVTAALETLLPGSSAFKDLLPGTISFELPAGEGDIEIECQTLPGFTLKIALAGHGTAEVSATVSQALRGVATVHYNVAEPTYVCIFLHQTAPSKIPARAVSSSVDAGAYVYGITVKPAKAPQSIRDVMATPSDGTRKVFHNGTLYIIRPDEAVFNAQGARVK